MKISRSLPIFLKQDIGRIDSTTIGLIVLDSFQGELHHLGHDQKLLKDRRLLAVLGKDKELSYKLKSSEVLQV